MRRKVDAGLKLSVIEQYKSSRQIDQSKTYCTPVGVVVKRCSGCRK